MTHHCDGCGRDIEAREVDFNGGPYDAGIQIVNGDGPGILVGPRHLTEVDALGHAIQARWCGPVNHEPQGSAP